MAKPSRQVRFPHPDERTPTVLLADGDVLIRLSLSDYLRRCGFKVYEAAQIRETLAILRTKTPVDLVLADVRLAGAKDGFELARRIRAEKPGLPVILASSDARKAAIARELCEAEPFFANPYDLDGALRALRKLLSSRKAAKTSRPGPRSATRRVAAR